MKTARGFSNLGEQTALACSFPQVDRTLLPVFTALSLQRVFDWRPNVAGWQPALSGAKRLFAS